MNVGVMRVVGHYYQSTHESLRSAYLFRTQEFLSYWKVAKNSVVSTVC